MEDATSFADTTQLIGTDTTSRTGSYTVRPAGQPVIAAFFGGNLSRELEQAGELESFARDELSGSLVRISSGGLRPSGPPAGVKTLRPGVLFRSAPRQADQRQVVAERGVAVTELRRRSLLPGILRHPARRMAVRPGRRRPTRGDSGNWGVFRPPEDKGNIHETCNRRCYQPDSGSPPLAASRWPRRSPTTSIRTTPTPPSEPDHMGGLSTWHGKVISTSGKVVVDTAAKTGTVDVTMDMKSIDFGRDKMNTHTWRRTCWISANCPRPPQRQDRPQWRGSVRGAGRPRDHGVTKPVTLKINKFVCKPRPSREGVCGAGFVRDIQSRGLRRVLRQGHGLQHGRQAADLDRGGEGGVDQSPPRCCYVRSQRGGLPGNSEPCLRPTRQRRRAQSR